MWFASRNGLNRYDGYELINIHQLPQNSSLAGYRRVESIQYIPHTNKIWSSSPLGIMVTDVRTFKSMAISTPFDDSSDDHRIKLFLASNGMLWASSSTGMVIKINPVTYTIMAIRRFDRMRRIDKTHFCELAENKKGQLFYINDNGSYHILDTANLHSIAAGDVKIEVHKMDYTQMFGVTLSSRLGIYQYDETSQEFKKVINSPDSVHNVMENDDGYWYVNNGYHLRAVTNGVEEDLGVLVDEYTPTSYSIYKLFVDRSDNLWLGTSKGLIKIPIRNRHFKRLMSRSDNRDRKHALSIRGMMEYKGYIYAGSYSGFYRINKLTNKHTLVHDTPYMVYDMLVHDGFIWGATEGSGLMRYHVPSGKMTFYSPRFRNDYERFRKYFSEIIYDSITRLFWLSNYNGVCMFDPKKLQFSKPVLTFQGVNFTGIRAMHMLVTADQHLWIATHNGVLELNTERKPINWYHTLKQGRLALTNNHVNHILESKNGLLYFSTMGGGINVLNRKAGYIKTLTMEDGLCNNNVYAMIEAPNGIIWGATNNGLTAFDPPGFAFKNFYQEDGITQNEFNHNSFLLADNKVYLGGVNGISAFESWNVFRDEKKWPLLKLRRIEYFDEEQKQMMEIKLGVDSINTIVLPPENKFLSIYFTLLDFRNVKKNIFAYKLVGLDNRWNNMGSESYIRLVALPAGDYKLHVKAAGADGRWLPQPLLIHIHVKQAIYKTWWFITLCVLLFGAIVYMVYRYRINQVKKMAEMRIKIASDLHDDVGSVLTRVGMQAELVKRQSVPGQETLLNSIAESCRSAMSNMRDVVWSIDARNDSVINLIDKMHETAEQLLGPAGIAYQFVYDKDEIAESIDMNARQNLFLIFKEAVNNIVKHSNASKVMVLLQLINGNLILRIKDNGSSSKDCHKSGSGLNNMELRAKKINASISVNTINGYDIVIKKHL